MKKTAIFSLSVYSVLHFAVDLVCAMAMFSQVGPSNPAWGVAILVYNYFAFAMQLPFGIIADRLDKNALVAGLGCIFVGVGSMLSGVPLLLAALTGIGNGLFHIGGGLDVLNSRGSKCAPAGIFVSPGALGLWLGTNLGSGGKFILALPIALIVCGVLLPIIFRKAAPGGENAEFSLPRLKTGAYIGGLLLFSVVVLRGASGMLFNFEWKPDFALPMILAVVLGKTAGGFAADIFGAKKTATVSLLAASILFLLSDFPLAGILAVFLFNMTMPLTLTAAADAFPGAKGASFGLMTFGLFCGFLPIYFGLATTSTLVYGTLALVSLGLIMPGLACAERAREL